jgi:hypothetical protein
MMAMGDPMANHHFGARSLVALVAAAALVMATAGCPRGSEALVPKTRRGWGVAFMVVGAAWVVTGGVVAADTDSDASGAERAGYGLAFGAIGVGLIALGWMIGGFGRTSPATAQPPAAPP